MRLNLHLNWGFFEVFFKKSDYVPPLLDGGVRGFIFFRIFVYLRWCNRKEVDGLSFLIYQDFLGFHSNSDYYIYRTYQKIICASKAMYEES